MTRGFGRAGWLLAVAFLFRLSMFLASDRPEIEAIFRVDILNCLALSLALLSPLDLVKSRTGRLGTAISMAALFAIATPMVWDGGATHGLPQRLAGYLSGRVPNATFPLFPWAAFAFAGHATGTWIGAGLAFAPERVMVRLLGAGILLMPLSMALDRLPTLGPRYDYWYTSPNFIMFKTGVLVLLLLACFGFERLARRAPRAIARVTQPLISAFVQMGRTSLFIYCVHIDLVYGSRAFPKLWKACEISEATRNLVLLTLAMLALSYAWSWAKSRVSAPSGQDGRSRR